MISPPILPLPPGSEPVPCEWTDELPGEPCGPDDEHVPMATHWFSFEQSDGGEPELEQRWMETWRVCAAHAASLEAIAKSQGAQA